MAKTATQSGLEDVLKSGVNYHISSETSKSSQYHNQVDQFLQYLQNSGRDPYLVQGIGQNPEQLGRMAEAAVKEEKKNLVTAVQANLAGVAQGLTPDQLTQIILESTDKKYQQVFQAVQSKDSEAIREAHAKRFEKDSVMIQYVLTATPDALLRSGESYLRKEQQRLLIDEFGDETEKDEKPAIMYNPEKAADYLAKAIKGLEDKKKQEVYLRIGKNFTENQMQAIAAKQAEEKKK